MDLKKFTTKILLLTKNVQALEKGLIYTFIHKNNCEYSNSKFFKDYLMDVDFNIIKHIQEYCKKSEINLNLYTIVEIFELLIPEDEKKMNGMVYTPTEVKEYIIKSLINTTEASLICDPACGCGSFLLSAAEYLHNTYNLTYKKIFETLLYGVDIIPHNIEKASLLFRLLGLINGEIIDNVFNLAVGNSLNFDWDNKFERVMRRGGFDYVIGNPPYVRSKNIQLEIKSQLNKWETASTGNVDLYIPFYELGLNLLNTSGKLGYISINTFLKSLNGRALRNYLTKLGYETTILDFKDTQIFKTVTSYTCIILIDKSKKNKVIYYGLCDKINELNKTSFTKLSYNNFINNDPWKLGSLEINENITKIESNSTNLNSYRIRNGLATLKNDIYFFTPLTEDNEFYTREYNGKTYRIERNICIDVIKPNIIRNEEQLLELMEKAIFPYTNYDGQLQVIPEDTLSKKFPETYYFLQDTKQILLNRDKGKGKYPEWYAYGRTQGMNNFGKKLLIPYMSNEPIAVICEKEDTLFYCGYAIFIDDLEEMKIIKKIIESDIFWYYIKNTSKPYASGYFSLAKNYIKNFGLPNITEMQKQELQKLTEKDEINLYVSRLYKLNY